LRIGDYLIQQGLITEEDLSRALNTQAGQRVPLGLLARQKGTLGNKEIFEILKGKRKSKGGTRDFLEIAVESGFLTDPRARRLRGIQIGSRELLGGILLSQGALGRKDLIRALRGFQSLTG